MEKSEKPCFECGKRKKNLTKIYESIQKLPPLSKERALKTQKYNQLSDKYREDC